MIPYSPLEKVLLTLMITGGAGIVAVIWAIAIGLWRETLAQADDDDAD